MSAGSRKTPGVPVRREQEMAADDPAGIKFSGFRYIVSFLPSGSEYFVVFLIEMYQELQYLLL